MHHQDVFGRNRAIGFELVQPVAFTALRVQHRVLRGLDGAIQRRLRRQTIESQRAQFGGSAPFGQGGITSSGLTVQRRDLPSERRAVRSSGTARALIFFSAVVGPARCRAGRGERRATLGAAKGTPTAAQSNSRSSSQLLRTATFVDNWVMPTAACETFTCVPLVKPGVCAILFKVSTASPIAHRQKRRMPVSLLGMSSV